MVLAITSFCVRMRNDILALLEMMLTASGQTMLCSADTKTKMPTLFRDVLNGELVGGM